MHDRRFPGRGRTLVRRLGLFLVLLGLGTIMLSLMATTTDVRAVPWPTFSLRKTVSYPPASGPGVSIGEVVTVTLTFTNTWDLSADVEVRDQNPAPWYLKILSDTITGGAYYIPGTIGVSEAVAWDDSLENDNPVTVTFQLQVLPADEKDDPSGQTVTNLAWLDSAATPGTLYDAEDWAEIYIKPATPVMDAIDNADGNGDYVVAWDEAEGAISYTVQVDDNLAFSSPATAYGGTGTQFPVSGQGSGIWYYRVQASNLWVSSPWSDSEAVSVLLPAPTLYPINNPDGSADYWIDWSDVASATTYTLEEDDNPAFSSPAVRYRGAVSQFQILDQAYGQWYYRVRAANTGVTGFWSDSQQVMVRPRPIYLPLTINNWPPLPGTPTLQPINNPGGLHSFRVEWTTAPQVQSYVLEEARTSSFVDAVQIYEGGATGLDLNRKQPTRYFYRVKGRNAWGDSAWSNVQHVDVRWESEPNDLAPSQANGAIVSGLTYYGTFPSGADINDYYYFELKEQRSVEVRLSNIALGHNYDLVLRTSALVSVGYSGELENQDERIVTGPLPAGSYYIQVYHRSLGGSEQAYHLEADFE